MSPSSIRVLAIGLLVVGSSSCGAPPEEGPTEEIQSALCNNQALQINNTDWIAKGDPGAVVFQNAAFFAFARTSDSKIQIVRETNLSGTCTTNTATFVTLTDTTSYGPALIAFNGMLHLAYVGQNRNLYLRRSSDGVTWSEAAVQIANGGNWEYHPALNVWAGGLRAFAVMQVCHWPNCLNNLVQIDISSPTNGPITVTGQGFTNEVTNDTPTSTTWNDDLYISWAGTDSNKPIYIKHFHGGTGWTSPTIISGAFGHPSLFPTSASRLTLIFRGNNGQIFTAASSDGTSFGSSTATSSTTNLTPAPFLLSTPNIWTLFIGTNSRVFATLIPQ